MQNLIQRDYADALDSFQESSAEEIDIADRLPPALVERILRAIAEAVVVTSADLSILWVNEAFTRITGYPLAEIRGLKTCVLRSGYHDEAFYEGVLDTLRTDGVWFGEMWRQRRNGEVFPALPSITALRDSRGEVEYFVDFFNDIGGYKKHQQHIEFLAYHDALTKLPNWHVLHCRLTSALARAKRYSNYAAVLFVDLDRFKQINDTYGHLAGNHLLCLVAERLKSSVREVDTVSRLGGDEFVVLVEGLNSLEYAGTVAAKIIAAFQQPFMLEGKSLSVTASIGVSCYPGEVESAEALLGRADRTMYLAKQAGRNMYLIDGPAKSPRIIDISPPPAA